MAERLTGGPIQRCTLCGRIEPVRHDGRGFPPDIAKRRLQKACEAAGCECRPVYRAGFDLTLPALPAPTVPDGGTNAGRV